MTADRLALIAALDHANKLEQEVATARDCLLEAQRRNSDLLRRLNRIRERTVFHERDYCGPQTSTPKNACESELSAESISAFEKDCE